MMAIIQKIDNHARTMFVFEQMRSFPKKILVWVAISERVIYMPLIRSSKSEAINSKISMNSRNVSQTQAIEKFWGCLAREVYENCFFEDLEVKLEQRIKTKLKEFDLKFVESLMALLCNRNNLKFLSYFIPKLFTF